jgi:hypothetical protein
VVGSGSGARLVRAAADAIGNARKGSGTAGLALSDRGGGTAPARSAMGAFHHQAASAAATASSTPAASRARPRVAEEGSTGGIGPI